MSQSKWVCIPSASWYQCDTRCAWCRMRISSVWLVWAIGSGYSILVSEGEGLFSGLANEAKLIFEEIVNLV